MKELGANAIRVYHVDPNGDPDECMKALADAGIYLFVDLDDFPTQIEEQSPIWSQKQVDAFKLTLDELQKYGNTAGVFVGSEVFTVANDSAASPYFLAAARDIGAYRDSKDYRLVCREDESERLDSFASTRTNGAVNQHLKSPAMPTCKTKQRDTRFRFSFQKLAATRSDHEISTTSIPSLGRK
ncbi:1,3-beta-glucanosyltransferase, variant [Blastomyces gilchristii SLH14081]|uniref:1,3-beta-glucanosyltransferase n=1 Tax=Blastomyces gilchristii (strain SLH14081) TaxID=559298 RepID=A0A179UG45_BLAGS|nr:1,3-beta-glucanosyltransferase, variant [Blastomyces gilchristii SLH14081]OAT07005.1 1,3-beta-glucanosyltransferase, variant [Blastomyces gilchristii SLH14081]